MWARIIGAIVFTLFFGFFGFFSFVISMFMSSQNGYVYVAILVIGILITINMLILGVFDKLPKWAKVLVPISLFVVPLGGYGGYEFYINTIEIKNAEVDLTQYEPFNENTKVVKLDEPATFQIEKNPPEIDGATALYPVYSAFARAVYPEGTYPHDNPKLSEVVVSKTNGAYKALVKFETDIIFTAGPSSQQRSELSEDMQMTPIGKEGFVFFVHDSNPVNSLTIEELQKIYSGEITNWKEVGGRNKDIIAFQRPEGSGSQTGLQNMMEGIPIMTPPTDQRVGGMGGVIEKASNYRNHRNAIGFSYRYFATQMKEDHGIKLLKVNGVDPNVESIKSGKYPLTAEFYAITNGSDHRHIEDFIDWILSDQGQRIIEKTGYVPIR